MPTHTPFSKGHTGLFSLRKFCFCLSWKNSDLVNVSLKQYIEFKKKKKTHLWGAKIMWYEQVNRRGLETSFFEGNEIYTFFFSATLQLPYILLYFLIFMLIVCVLKIKYQRFPFYFFLFFLRWGGRWMLELIWDCIVTTAGEVEECKAIGISWLCILTTNSV